MADENNSENTKDPLFGNKVAAAVLAALLLVFGLPHLTKVIFGGGHHGGKGEELHLAYCCVELENSGGGEEEEAPVDFWTIAAEATAGAGQRRAALCASCHTFDEGGANLVGPNLWNVVGRPVASAPGFNYTAALSAAGGEWTYERLNEYIANSQEYVPGSSMVQVNRRDDHRAQILVYLGSLSDNPVPLPAPAAPALEEVVETSAEEIVEEAGAAVEDAASEFEDAVAEKVENLEAMPGGVESILEEAQQ